MCRTRILAYITGLIAVFSGNGFAQNGHLLTLEECLEIGLRNNSALKTAAYQVERSGAAVKGSYSGILPRINLSSSTGRSTRGQTVNFENIPVTDPVTGAPVKDPETGKDIFDRVEVLSPTRSYSSYGLSLTYSQTLYDFGRSFNAIKQSKASFNATAELLNSEKNSAYALIKQRYFEYLKAIRLQQEYQEAVNRSKEQLEQTTKMRRIGTAAQIDVYRQEVALGQDEINLITQQDVVEIAMGNLNVAMGQDPQTAIAVAEVEYENKPLEMSLEEAYAIAEENNPDLRRIEYEMQSAEYGRKIAKNNFLPTIDVSARYSRDNQNLDRVYSEFGRNYFFNLGASFNLNLFNGFSDDAQLAQQSASYAIAKENYVAQQRDLYLQVKQAYLNLRAASRIAQINETNLRSAEEEYRLADERYRLGAGTQLEVTEAQVSLTRARVQLVRTKYDAIIARAQLESAIGNLNLPGENE